jgi:signal recognition particle receptor subunit beta
MYYVIIIAGTYGCGKTTFIDSVCHEPGQTQALEAFIREVEPHKNEDHYCIKYGGLCIDLGDQLYMIETSGTRRFDGMWTILANLPIVGTLVFVDSSKPEAFREGYLTLETWRAYTPLPVICVANYQDRPNAFAAEDLRTLLRIENLTLPCVAIDPQSAKSVVIRLLELYLKELSADSLSTP